MIGGMGMTNEEFQKKSCWKNLRALEKMWQV